MANEGVQEGSQGRVVGGEGWRRGRGLEERERERKRKNRRVGRKRNLTTLF